MPCAPCAYGSIHAILSDFRCSALVADVSDSIMDSLELKELPSLEVELANVLAKMQGHVELKVRLIT